MGSLIGCLTATRAALSADEKANLNDLKSEAIARGMGDHAAEVYAIESMLSEAIDSYVSVVSQVESALGISKKKKNKAAQKADVPTPITKPLDSAAAQAKELPKALTLAESKEKIEDFGEVLHGAKKHYAAAYADKMKSALEADIAAVPLSQSWPEPDYNKLIESGADKDAVAWARALRDEVADKPRASWKVKGWAEKVAILRNFASDILSGEASADAVRKAAAAKPLLGSVVGRADLYEEFGHDTSLKGVTFRQRHFTLYRGEENVTKWMIERPAKASAFGNWPQELGVGNTREEAIAQFRKNIEKLANQSETKGKSVRFDIYSRRGETGFIIGKKVGKNYIDLMRFDSTKEARAYLQDNQAALEEKLSRMKEIPRERRETNAPRIGVDHRNGGDVTPEQFSEAFGFRGVQFGNYVEGKRRQQDLNDAYDALMDLAGVLNLPPKALSLNGTLGLAFGARGTGGKNPYSAHYEPDTVVINLTKNIGAGSLAHELWHAIDNYFSRMRGDKGEFVTEYPRQKFPGDDSIRPEMIEAFSQLTKAINQSRLKQRSQMLDNRRSKAYWTTGREMSARSFESYIIAKLQDQGASNDYLANIVSEEYWSAAEGLGLESGSSYPYPQAAEIPKIRAAFDEFFQTVETKETDSGVAMFSIGDDSDAAIGEDGSIPKVEADEVIASVTARWGKPDIVNLVDRFTDLPPAIKRAAAAHRASPNQVKGAIHNGRLYVVRENHKTAASLARTVFHEAYGHYGIRALFGKEIHQKLNQLFIAIGGVRGFNEMAARHGVDLKLYRGMDNLPQEMRRAAMMEELLSHMAEDQRPSIARRAKEIIGMVRKWLRDHGFPFLGKLGDTDIAYLLKQARERTIAGEEGSIIAKPAFSLRDQTETPAFKRWFGNSKVVDSNGEPLVVYHGSPNSGIVSFDRSREGGNTGAADAQHGLGGFYFSDDSNVADTYARTIDVEMANVAEQEFGISPRVSLPQSTTYPVYLSIKNPLRVDGIVTRKMLDKAERDGHDGVIARIGPQTEYVAFRPEQIKSSIGNNGNFDPDSANIMFSLQDDEQTHDALAKLGLAPKKRKTIAGIIAQYTQRDWKSLLKQLGERGYEGWVDGLIGIKRAEESLGVGIGAGDYQRSGYVGARLATGIADLMHGILFYGAPEWRDGVTQYRAGTKGLIEVLQQLEGDELTDWLAWMGANRAQELMDQGRENNLTQDEIDTLKAGSQGNEAKFEQVRQDYLKINRAMLDLAQDAGLIKAESRAAWESEWYVPFYRMSEADGEAALLGPTTKRGLSHQSSGIRALKGADLATNDLMENIIANWLKLADASLKNDALRRTVDILDGSDLIKNESMRWSKVVVPRSEIAKHIEQDRKAQLYWAEALGMPEGASAMEIVGELNALDKSGFESLWHRVAPTDKDIVRVMRDGKASYYRITASDGGALLRALTQVQGDRVDNVLLRAGRWSKRLLTTGVTASPEFILRNFIRDAAHAWAINPDGFTFGVDSLRGLREAWAEDEAYRTLMFAGASFQGGYVHGTDPEASAQIIRRALEKKGLTPTQIEGHLSTVVNSAAKAKDLAMMAWQAYREVGDKVENANRVATFEAALKAGKPLAQAAFESKDLMDYSRRGNAAAANIFMDLIPFLNARLQGLDKLARAGFSTPKLIGAAMLKIALWSVFLAWLNDDEDDYKALPDWEKDAYWHIYLGDSHWRIPKPFEIGLLAGTIPERMWHAWIADTQPDDKVVWSMAHGMMETLNFNPIPQAVLPVAEIVANRSFFFNTPIESQRDQGVQPEARYDSFTSDSAVLAGKALGLSPKQIEHLWKGYTGTMGGYAMALTDMLVRGVRGDADRPEMRPEDLVLVRALYRGEDAPRSTQYQIDFYNRLREVEQIYGTVKQYQKEGDIDAARSERDEGREKLRYRGLLTNTADVLSDLRKREKYIMDHPTMPAGEKRLKLNAINQKRNDLLKRAAERTEGVF